jgi:hypothetical protein
MTRLFCDRCGAELWHTGQKSLPPGPLLCIDKEECNRLYASYLRFRAYVAERFRIRAEEIARQ